MGIPIIYVSRFESAGYFDNWMEDVLLPDDTVGLSSAEPTQTDKYRFENTLYKLRSWGSAKDKVAQNGQNRPKWLWLIWAIETAFSD